MLKILLVTHQQAEIGLGVVPVRVYRCLHVQLYTYGQYGEDYIN